MIKSIIEAYKGEISYETSLKKGTLFLVSFPKKQT
jgi:signal transduction histidine kinase